MLWLVWPTLWIRGLGSATDTPAGVLEIRVNVDTPNWERSRDQLTHRVSQAFDWELPLGRVVLRRIRGCPESPNWDMQPPLTEDSLEWPQPLEVPEHLDSQTPVCVDAGSSRLQVGGYLLEHSRVSNSTLRVQGPEWAGILQFLGAEWGWTPEHFQGFQGVSPQTRLPPDFQLEAPVPSWTPCSYQGCVACWFDLLPHKRISAYKIHQILGEGHLGFRQYFAYDGGQARQRRQYLWGRMPRAISEPEDTSLIPPLLEIPGIDEPLGIVALVDWVFESRIPRFQTHGSWTEYQFPSEEWRPTDGLNLCVVGVPCLDLPMAPSGRMFHSADLYRVPPLAGAETEGPVRDLSAANCPPDCCESPECQATHDVLGAPLESQAEILLVFGGRTFWAQEDARGHQIYKACESMEPNQMPLDWQSCMEYYTNELWRFDVRRKTWQYLKVDGQVASDFDDRDVRKSRGSVEYHGKVFPQVRYGQASLIVPNVTGPDGRKHQYFYVYGGFSPLCVHGICDDVWRYQIPDTPASSPDALGANTWYRLNNCTFGGRYRHQMVLGGDLQAYVFGGQADGLWLSDLLVYHIGNDTWQNVSAQALVGGLRTSQTLSGGQQTLNVSLAQMRPGDTPIFSNSHGWPSARGDSAFFKRGHHLMVMGGFRTFANETLVGEEDPHTPILSKDLMMLEESKEQEFVDDLEDLIHRSDQGFSAEEWRQNRPPPPEVHYSGEPIPGDPDRVYRDPRITQPHRYYPGDLWMFDLQRAQWQPYLPKDYGNPWPAPRRGHQLKALSPGQPGSPLYMMGGHQGETIFGDLWVFQESWHLLEGFGDLPPRTYHSMVYSETQEELLIFGGQTWFTPDLLEADRLWDSFRRCRDSARDLYEETPETLARAEAARLLCDQLVPDVQFNLDLLGDVWTLKINPCVPPCVAGDCVRGRCVCPPTRKGAACGEKVCLNSISLTESHDLRPTFLECSNHGTCLQGQCVCFKGFQGEACEQVDCPRNCSSTPDVVRGQCLPMFPVAQCDCAPGYAGRACEKRLCPNQCSGHGQCQPSGMCTCQAHWTGPDCSILLEDLEAIYTQIDLGLPALWVSHLKYEEGAHQA